MDLVSPKGHKDLISRDVQDRRRVKESEKTTVRREESCGIGKREEREGVVWSFEGSSPGNVGLASRVRERGRPRKRRNPESSVQ